MINISIYLFFLKIEKQEPILLPPQPTRKELAEIRKHNLEVRSEVYRAVRRPGRGMYFFTFIFSYLPSHYVSANVNDEYLVFLISFSSFSALDASIISLCHFVWQWYKYASDLNLHLYIIFLSIWDKTEINHTYNFLVNHDEWNHHF